MTDKLRSVIEDQETFVRTVSYQITVDEDNAVPLRFARKALHRLTTGILDAIIKDLPEIEVIDATDPQKTTYANAIQEAKILGKLEYKKTLLKTLAQAREELSTSLTQ